MKAFNRDFTISLEFVPLIGAGVGLERTENYTKLIILLPFMGWSLKF